MKKLKKGDSVIIISGKDKGKKGEILRVVEPDKLVISNVNLAKKHVKPNPNKQETGGIIEREMPMHISNVMILNPLTKKGDKIGFKKLEDGKKVRIYKSNQEVIDI
jgi:large subunit ribosomal protein L24|tara:strand:- start:103 stop:420 length:318 start_codon:yes stop_codon:yes gene_type:complete